MRLLVLGGASFLFAVLCACLSVAALSSTARQGIVDKEKMRSLIDEVRALPPSQENDLVNAYADGMESLLTGKQEKQISKEARDAYERWLAKRNKHRKEPCEPAQMTSAEMPTP